MVRAACKRRVMQEGHREVFERLMSLWVTVLQSEGSTRYPTLSTTSNTWELNLQEAELNQKFLLYAWLALPTSC